MEVKHLGGYRLIYPEIKNEIKIERYKRFEVAARDLFEYFNNNRKRVQTLDNG